MRRRTEITIETSRRVVVRQFQAAVRVWCGDCTAEVMMVSANEAAALAGVSSRTIYRWIEDGEIHFVEDSGGLIRVCANSIGNANRNRDE